jgi:hypothetical protein
LPLIVLRDGTREADFVPRAKDSIKVRGVVGLLAGTACSRALVNALVEEAGTKGKAVVRTNNPSVLILSALRM